SIRWHTRTKRDWSSDVCSTDLGMFIYLWMLALAGGEAAGIDGVTGFVISVVAAVVPVTILIPLILALDRLEPEPRSVLFFAFVRSYELCVWLEQCVLLLSRSF